MDVLFIESINLIAAARKLFHGPQEVRKAWMFSFLLGCKVCSGEGWCTSLLGILSRCCARPTRCTLLHGGDKMSTLTCGAQLGIVHLAAEDFLLGSEYLCPVHHQTSLVKAGLLLRHLLIAP